MLAVATGYQEWPMEFSLDFTGSLDLPHLWACGMWKVQSRTQQGPLARERPCLCSGIGDSAGVGLCRRWLRTPPHTKQNGWQIGGGSPSSHIFQGPNIGCLRWVSPPFLSITEGNFSGDSYCASQPHLTAVVTTPVFLP